MWIFCKWAGASLLGQRRQQDGYLLVLPRLGSTSAFFPLVRVNNKPTPKPFGESGSIHVAPETSSL